MGSTIHEDLTADELSRLARSRDHAVVSILLPPRPVAEARLTLRNLVRDVEARAKSIGAAAVAGAAVPSLLAYADEPDHWRLPEVSAAIYADGEALRVCPGPATGPPLAVVAPRFHLTHLIGAAPTTPYAVAALSRGTSHLYRGVGDRITEITTEGLPASMDQVLRFDDREPQLQSHGSSRRGGGTVIAAFHGQGGKSDQLEDLARYLRFVAAEVEAVLGGEPLVLAATQEMAAAFRNVTSYGAVAAEIIVGSPERSSIHELAAAAAPLIEEMGSERRRSAVALLAETGEPRVTHDLGEVVTAAYDGRVELLAVAEGGHVWGAYDVAARRVTEEDREPGGVDLLNEAATETWLHGGEVVLAPGADTPSRGPVAARLRF